MVEKIYGMLMLNQMKIFILNKTYPYLFWEADSYIKQDMNKGFIVKSEDAENFLEEKLKILGLNNKESITSFIKK